MKLLKKISMVYTLQIFAVILLFGYAVASPFNKTRKGTVDGKIPLEYIKLPPIITDKDSILTRNINAFWNHTPNTR